MHGHDGCGCGHAHGQMDAPETQVDATMDGTMESHAHMDVGCGDGACGPSHDGQGGCGAGCGCGSPQGLDAVETAAIQGFLSGLYAANLDHDNLIQYLEQMSQQDGSEFQRPAQLLASALTAMPREEASKKSVSTRLLEFISGEQA